MVRRQEEWIESIFAEIDSESSAKKGRFDNDEFWTWSVVITESLG